MLKQAALGLPALAASGFVLAACTPDTLLPNPTPSARAEPRRLLELPGLLSVTPAPNSTQTGVAPVAVTFSADVSVTEVTLCVGKLQLALDETAPGIWKGTGWNTLARPAAPELVSPSDFCAWVRIAATIDGTPQESSLFPVFTGNYNYGELPSPGWHGALAWSADYTDIDRWRASYSGRVVGAAYASLIADPLVGAVRNVVTASIPDEAAADRDQPTPSPRFQAAQPTDGTTAGLDEGNEFYVGFSVFVPSVDSAEHGAGGFPTVVPSTAGSTDNHIAIYQLYGPQAATPVSYPRGRGAIINLDANRTSDAESGEQFGIRANQLNGGDPWPLVEFGYNRGAWTDIVIGMRLSADIRHGWIEVHLNQGATASVRPAPLFGGRTRVPRVGLWPESSVPAVPETTVDGVTVTGGSSDQSTQMQIYRRTGVYPEVTLLHTAHRVGPTVESVDPGSYA